MRWRLGERARAWLHILAVMLIIVAGLSLAGSTLLQSDLPTGVQVGVTMPLLLGAPLVYVAVDRLARDLRFDPDLRVAHAAARLLGDVKMEARLGTRLEETQGGLSMTSASAGGLSVPEEG